MIVDRLTLAGKVALITGGGAGIGQGIALAFAELGADLIIAEREAARCEDMQARLKAMGRRVLALPMDVCDEAAVTALFARIDDDFGRLDILVNNAGGVAPKSFMAQSARARSRIMDLNLGSVFNVTQQAAERMIRGGTGGVIINIASIEGTRAAPLYAVYAACKAGLLNLTRTLAVELSDHGIRVNAIAPDYTDTPGLRGNTQGPVDPSTWLQPSAAQQDANRRRIPLGRPGTIAECADAAVYLATDLSRYVTGVCLPVDGGTSGSGGWVRRSDGRWSLVGDMAE